ncbi:MAG: STAS domain-containing protein [Candidatus Sulfotelmatobacter sp.]
MTARRRPVTVMHLPEQSGTKERRVFLREVERRLNMERPYLVLDCSNVVEMEGSTVHLLLCCLEEAMKRNGDVKLAGVPLMTEGVPGLTGSSRLFEIFDTTADAINSFHQLPLGAFSEADESESAA